MCWFIPIVFRLENALRNFACLTKGDVIAINYNEKVIMSVNQYNNNSSVKNPDALNQTFLSCLPDLWVACHGDQTRQGCVHHWVWYECRDAYLIYKHTINVIYLIYITDQKFWVSRTGKINELIHLFSKDALNWSNSMLGHVMLKIILSQMMLFWTFHSLKKMDQSFNYNFSSNKCCLGEQKTLKT